MIKPRSAIARIGVGLAIVAGLSMGAPAASFAQDSLLANPQLLVVIGAGPSVAARPGRKEGDVA